MNKYETYAKNGKLIFRILEGSFKDVEYVYESLDINGKLKYKIKNKKSTITDTNRLLFESTIRSIIKDKLSRL